MNLIVAGVPRSGTTLLQLLCHAHPEIALTNEVGSFALLGKSYLQYCLHVFDRWKRVQNKWAFDVSYAANRNVLSWNNFRYLLIYALRLRKHCDGRITVRAIGATYRDTYPKATVVGDKWPLYLFRMDNYANESDLRRLVIYRDCRDVTSSFLAKARTTWRDTSWIGTVDTAAKIARHWLRGIAQMEKHAETIWILRYEDLVRQPKKELDRLADHLGVNACGFDHTMVDSGRTGKYVKGLTSDELEDVMRIAGPTMERLGYV